MAGPSEIVTSTFGMAREYAQAAQGQLSSFTAALDGALYAPAVFDARWETITAREIPSLPAPPTFPTAEFKEPSQTPGGISEQLPEPKISTFTESAPTIRDLTPPNVSYGAAPTIPTIGHVTVPLAPTINTPAAPALLSLQTISIPQVNTHPDWIARLQNTPTLEILQPTPYQYTPGERYASLLLENVKARLNERLAGGTGLPAAVERAIWDRARSREASIARAEEATVMRNGEALGYAFPPGVLAQQLREAQVATAGRLAELNRDISIKQADLEQSNLKDAIAAGMQLEEKLIDQSLRLEQLAFDSSRAAAENAVQMHNAQVQHLQTLLQAYQAYAAGYKTTIEAEMAKVEIYKAQLEGERTKATINSSAIEQYKALIQAGMAQVEVYRAQIAGAQTLVELEKAKIGAAGEQVRAYVAQVNAETAKVEAYKAGVDAQNANMQGYKIKADAFAARVSAEAEQARALVARYTALQTSKAAEWDGYRARVQAESARLEAIGRQASAQLEGFRAQTVAVTAQAEMHSKAWEANLKQYEAGKQLALQAAKVNQDSRQWAATARLDAVKVGTQTYAQLLSSAYGMMHTQASISAGGATNVSYNYSGQVDGSPPAMTGY